MHQEINYKLMDILNIHRSRRTSKLIIDIDELGNSINTYFVLTPELRIPGDIRKTMRVLNGKKRLELTQGRNFQFQEGMILYDNIAAYSKPWGEALSLIEQSVQIIAASNAFYISKLKYNMMLTGNEELEDQISPTLDMRAINMVDTGKLYYNPGYVKFILFRSDKSHKNLMPVDIYECTQWDFVIYIITGYLMTLELRKTKGWSI